MPAAYETVVGGRLRVKGKALHVKTADGISKIKKKKKKKKKKPNHLHAFSFQGGNIGLSTDHAEEDMHENGKDEGEANALEDHLTPAERKFLQQTRELELKRLAKMATKSHRDRIQEFNQHLANLTEHYDIPKVGPG